MTKWRMNLNERIKELMLEAGKTIPGDKHIDADFCEKFAELIVRECIEQVITGPNGPAHYAVEAAIRLKKHFGVEE